MNQFSDELCGVNKIKIDTFSCGHVIPPSSLAAAILCKGPSGQPLEFTYENRSNPVVAERLLQDAGQLVLNLSKVVPDGLVVFFPSYDYEEKAHEYWQRKGVLGKVSPSFSLPSAVPRGTRLRYKAHLVCSEKIAETAMLPPFSSCFVCTPFLLIDRSAEASVP
jgi:Rad3-related DNA helicase